MLVTLVGGSSEAFGQTAQLQPTIQPAKLLQAILPQTAPIAAPVAAPAAKLTLGQLVATDTGAERLDEEESCLATAVYLESLGEPLEGQLAVAQVVINRAASGQYPTSWCGVVKQKCAILLRPRPAASRASTPAAESWRKAQAIARIAMQNASDILPTDVLWYHADYVAPNWGSSLRRVEKIGAHIFYRA